MLTSEEAYEIKVASDPFVYGESVFYTINWIEDNRYRSSIYRYDGNGNERVTFGGNEKKPYVTDKGLFYISYNEDEERLLLVENLKEPKVLYKNRSISKFIFHGNSILAIVQDKADPESPIATTKLKYRFDTAGFLRTRPKLVEISENSRDLVSGDFDVVDVASNGNRVVFSATIEDDDRGLEDIYDLEMSNGTFRKVTTGEGTAGTVSVDCNCDVSYIGHRKGVAPWVSSSLIFPESGKEISIGNTADNTVNSDLFVSGSQSLIHDSGKFYLLGQEGGSSFVYAYGKDVEKLTPEMRSVRAFHVNNGNLAYVCTTPEKPSLLVFKGRELDLNPDVKGKVPERIRTPEGEAWIMLSGKDNPTIVSVHGGPQTAYGYAYSIEFNYYINHGFNVLFGNPRGSDGYGEEFAKGCIGDWGGKDFGDIMGFVDAAKEKYSLNENFSITGGSYGGYMTNAAITKTGRFKSAIAERCVSNLMSMCGTSDIGFWFNAIESEVEDPWSEEGMEKLLSFSPVTKAKNVTTPTMFIHGEEDYRCPIEQSEQMYSALKLSGIEAMLVRYPGDSHEHARRGVPINMKDRLERKLGWFKTHM